MTDAIVPFTFPAVDAYLQVLRPTDTRLRVSFDFRSYNIDGLLLLHNPTPGTQRFTLKINGDGYLEYSIQTANDPVVTNIITNRDPMSKSDTFIDGLWHSVVIDVLATTGATLGRVNVTVDGRPDVSIRQLSFTTAAKYLVGGGDLVGGETGFVGCIRRLFIQGDQVILLATTSADVQNFGSVINGTCAIHDRCNPNPCEHGGVCSQDFDVFSCDCGDSGYGGAVCHTSKYLISCEEAKLLNPLLPNLNMMVDIDDSGPLNPLDRKSVV